MTTLTKGQKISIAQKRNYALGLRKPINYWQNKTRSIEDRAKISKGRKGIRTSEETKRKLSLALKGRKNGPLSKEHRKKLSEAAIRKFKRGFKVWNYELKGIHLSPKSEFKKGQYTKEKNINWKNGITKLNRLIRMMPEFHEQRNKVYKRDNYICQECKKQASGKLHMHHIVELAKLIEKHQLKTTEEARKCDELWSVENCKTLCKECHLIHHGLLKKTVNSGNILTGNAEDNPDPSQELKVLGRSND